MAYQTTEIQIQVQKIDLPDLLEKLTYLDNGAKKMNQKDIRQFCTDFIANDAYAEKHNDSNLLRALRHIQYIIEDTKPNTSLFNQPDMVWRQFVKLVENPKWIFSTTTGVELNYELPLPNGMHTIQNFADWIRTHMQKKENERKEEEATWTNCNGQELLISEMSTQYIKNCIKFEFRKPEKKRKKDKIMLLQKELDSRHAEIATWLNSYVDRINDSKIFIEHIQQTMKEQSILAHEWLTHIKIQLSNARKNNLDTTELMQLRKQIVEHYNL